MHSDMDSRPVVLEYHASPALKALWAAQIARMTPEEREELADSLKRLSALQAAKSNE